MITSAQFKAIFPNCPARKGALYLPLLVAAMRESAITNRRRAAAFLAQVGHESLDFKYMEEIASGAAYEGRKDLGNFRPGDGRRFKGRGPIQTTGRLNYTSAGIALGLPLDEQPELLALPEYGFRASAYFWKSNKLNTYADALTMRGDEKDLGRFDKITRRINGGYNHRVERQRRYLIALSVLTDKQFEAVRLEQTLSVLTIPAAAPSPDVASAPGMNSGAATTPVTPVPQVAAVFSPSPSAVSGAGAVAVSGTSSPETSLLDEIPMNEETKAVGGSLLRRLGLRIGGGIVALWASGVVGRLLIILAVVAAAYFIYRERKAIASQVRKLVRKLKGEQ